MAYRHSEIIDVAPAHFSSLWLRIGTFIALCGSLFSPQNAFIIRSLSDHQNKCQGKWWYNRGNLAVYFDHLYTGCTQCRTSDMFLSGDIYAPAWIVAQ
jgi:hypothetical protein